MKIADIPGREKPRERLARLGPSALSDRELLAIVIRTGGPGQSALEVADELLANAGGLVSLSSARLEELDFVAHLGPAKAAGLQAVFELGRRASHGKDARPVVVGPEDLARICEPLLAGKPHEEAIVIVLNAANRVTKTVTLSNGSVGRCLMMPRDVLATVLRNDGVAFAVAHNHPSGDPSPSREDIKVTRELSRAAETIGVHFIDHLIIGSGAWISLRDSKGFG